jgi:hypothetical protein
MSVTFPPFEQPPAGTGGGGGAIASIFNSSGIPSNQHVALPRGVLLLSRLQNNLPVGGFRHVGNLQEASLSMETSNREHLDHTGELSGGFLVPDKVIPQQITARFDFTADHSTARNIALYMSGRADENVENPAADPDGSGGAVTYSILANTLRAGTHNLIHAPLVTGASGQLLDSTRRAIDLEVGQVTYEQDGTPLVEGEDITTDWSTGMFFIHADGDFDPTEDLDITIAAPAGTPEPIDRVSFLTTAGESFAAVFIAKNQVSGRFNLYHFHRITVIPTGSYPLISDEFATMQFQATLERNPTADPEFAFGYLIETDNFRLGAENALNLVV